MKNPTSLQDKEIREIINPIIGRLNAESWFRARNADIKESHLQAEELNKFSDEFVKVIQQVKEEDRKEQKRNIEQAMVYFFKQLPEWIMPKPRYMSEKRRDSLWSHMCMWSHEYVDSLVLSTPSQEKEGEK